MNDEWMNKCRMPNIKHNLLAYTMLYGPLTAIPSPNKTKLAVNHGPLRQTKPLLI